MKKGRFTKIIISIIVIAFMLFAISFIDSIIFNKDKKGNENKKYLHITYMLVDKDKTSDDINFEGFSNDMVTNLDYVYHFYQTEVDVEKDGEYYVANINNMNKVVLDNIVDNYFSVTNLNAQTIDDIKFDEKKLKVYIPSKYFEDEKYKYEGTDNEVLDNNSPVQAEFMSRVSEEDYAKVNINLEKTKFKTKKEIVSINNDTSYTNIKITKDNTKLSNNNYKVYINDSKYPLEESKYSYSSKDGTLKLDYYPIQINKVKIKYRKLSILNIFGLSDASATTNPIIGTYSGNFAVGMEETYFLPYMYGSAVADRNGTCSSNTYLYCGGQIASGIDCSSLSSNWVSKNQVCTAWQSYMADSVIASDGLRSFALRLVNQPGGTGSAVNISEIADVPVSFNYSWLNADCETHFTAFNNSSSALPVSFRVTEIDQDGTVTIEFNSKYSSGGQLAGGRFRLKRGTTTTSDKAKPGVNIELNKTYQGTDYSNAVFGYTIDGNEAYLNNTARSDYMDIYNTMQSIYTALGQGQDRPGIIHNSTLVYKAGGYDNRVSAGYLSYITDTIAKAHSLSGNALTTAKRNVGEILLGSSWSITDAELENLTWEQVIYRTLNLGTFRGTASEIVSYETCDGSNILSDNPSLACDGTTDNNLRFIGQNPNNYVSFNGQKWRIIGFMNNIKQDSSDTTGETRIKIVYDIVSNEFFDSSSNLTNSFPSATVSNYLNVSYYNGLNGSAKDMIDDVYWNIGGAQMDRDYYSPGTPILTATQVYYQERGNLGPAAEPNLTRWQGKVGLIYASDYFFATSGSSNADRQDCFQYTSGDNLSMKQSCYTYNWLKASNSTGYWILTSPADPVVEGSYYNHEHIGRYVGYNLHWQDINWPYGFAWDYDITTNSWARKGIRPTVYLKPDISIVGGSGTNGDPYILGAGSTSLNNRYATTTNESNDSTNGDTTIYEGSFGDILTTGGLGSTSSDYYVKELITDDSGIVMDDRIYKISVSYVANNPTTSEGLKTGTYSYTVYRSTDATNWETMYSNTLPNQNINDFPTITLTNQDVSFSNPSQGNFDNGGTCCDENPKYGAIKVKKILDQAESNDTLTGYKFKVHDVTNNVDNYIYTDTTGVATYGYTLGGYSLSVGSSYEISEVLDNDGYAIRLVDGVEKSSNFKPRDNTPKSIVISNDTVNDFATTSFTNYKEVYCAKVVKVDAETNKVLQGATFVTSDGQTGTTDTNGVVIFTNLNNSTYTVMETTPEGTLLTDSDGNTYSYHNDDPTPHAVTIAQETYSDGVFTCPQDVPTTITNSDTKVYYCLKVKKLDYLTGDPLEGATFRISQTGVTPDEDEITTDTNGIASFFIGDSSKAGTYDIEEIVAPPGYNLLSIIQSADAVALEHFASEADAKAACKTNTVKDINGELVSSVTYDSNNGDNSYVFNDNKTNTYLLNFFKYSENNEKLNSAEFKVINSSGKYLTVSSNKLDITDSNNVTKKCYIYTGANSTGSILTTDDVSPAQDGSMSGEICIAGLDSGTYGIGEVNPAIGHAFTSDIFKSSYTSSTAFRSDTVDFTNQPTKLVFTKNLINTDGSPYGTIDNDTLTELTSLTFNIYTLDSNGQKTGNALEFIKTSDGVYEYAGNLYDSVSGTPSTTLNIRGTDLKFEVYHLPYGDYMVEEASNSSGFYSVNKNYDVFTIDRCSNEGATTLRCLNSKYEEASIDNAPTEIEFTKEDLYEYYDNTDVASINDNTKLFDTIGFVVRDSSGNIISLKCTDPDGVYDSTCSYGYYRYLPVTAENTVTTIHTLNGKLNILRLSRGKKYYIEEVSSDSEGNFALRTDLTYQGLPFNNNGHPVVTYELDRQINIRNYSTKTGIISNVPTRVAFEKKDAKYGYTITDETTTFNVYQCENLQAGEHCTENNGTLINFETRGVIPGDNEDSNAEVYKYKKNNASGVTDLHPYNGKLVLRYLPSDSKYSYVLVETKAPEGYLLPTNGNQYTEFTVSGNDIHEVAIAVNNQPTGIIIYKYDSKTGAPLPGAKFKIYKVINYDSTKTLEEQTKELISLKSLRDGEYIYGDTPNTSILITCDDNNGTCAKENPKTLGESLFGNGTILIEYLPNNNYYIIEEVEAPQGYDIGVDKYKLIYLENNETSVEYTSVYNDQTIYYYCLKVKKTDNETGNPLQGATFRISQTGVIPVEDTATTDVNGIATFFLGDNSTAGTYDIEETVAPQGYAILPVIQSVNAINIGHFDSASEAEEACKSNTTTDIDGNPFNTVTYDSNNGENDYVIKDIQNKVLINFFKLDENSNGGNGAEFKIKNSNDEYITVSSNKTPYTDSNNITKNCYTYTGKNATGSVLVSSDVSVSSNSSMNGEVCVAGLDQGSYIVEEIKPLENHTFGQTTSKTITASTTFRSSTNDFVNTPTKLEFTKELINTDGTPYGTIDNETLTDLSSLTFNIYALDTNGEKTGNALGFIKTSDGVYEYAGNNVDPVSGTPTTDLNIRSTDLKFEVYHLPYGDYVVEEASNTSGYYSVNKNYDVFEIDEYTNSSNQAESSIENAPTEIEFTKEDLYEYYDNTDAASAVENTKLFDTIDFVLRDASGNIVNLKCTDADGVYDSTCSHGYYRYLPVNAENTVTTIHTLNGKLNILRLSRDTTYYIEETSSDSEGNFVLRTDLTYQDLPFNNNGHPVVTYELERQINVQSYSSKTGIIQNIPTRVAFNKKDAKYGYLITDETTTFNVYQCENLQAGEHCTENNGTLINFETRGVITGDNEDSNIEVYKYKKNNASGVTDLHPYNGKLVLRYLPSDSKYSYVLVETRAPAGYLVPTNGDQYTEFTVSGNDIHGLAIAVDNQPTGVLVYKYDTNTGAPLPGAKFKIYKVINYDNTKTLEEQTKELISLKSIRDGEYEYSTTPNVDVMITCNDDNGTCAKQNPKTIGQSLFGNGIILIEYLPNNNYYIIEEVEAPTGYEIGTDKYKLIYLENNETSVEYTSVYNSQKPDDYYCLKVKKTDKVTSEGLQGAVFNISNPSVTPDTVTATTNFEGVASFFIGGEDKVADYTVSETTAPNGYYLSTDTLTVRPIKLSRTESVEEARALCLTSNATDSDGVKISTYTYNSDDENVRKNYIISNNKSLLNFYKVNDNEEGINEVTFKVKMFNNTYITVKDINNDNKVDINDRVSISDGNNTKLCYVYNNSNRTGNILYTGDVSVIQDGSMNGEICISNLPGSEGSTNNTTYYVKEEGSIATLVNKGEEKEISSSKYFQSSGNINKFINYPTYVKFIKNVDNTYSSSEGDTLSGITTNELMQIPFIIYDINDNAMQVTSIGNGEYVYDENSYNTVMYINNSREIIVRGLPKGNYTIVELDSTECSSGNDKIGYYNPSDTYSFTIDDCSSEFGIDSETCNNRITTREIYNIPTELDFTKKDFYEDETGTFVDEKERSDFDKIGFKVKDSEGNYIRFIKIGNVGTCEDDDSYSIYRAVYDNTIEGTVDVLNTCGGHIKVLNLNRGETYTIEEISVPDDSIYVLEGNPSITVTIGCEGEVGRSSTTAVISDKPTRVVFEKKDSRYGYTILDETTTFNVYKCELGTSCDTTNGELVNFYERSVITGDEEDSNVEVYRYNKDQGVTDLHPYNGKLVLRYLPSGYNYILVETKAPNGYLLPVLDAAKTNFTVINSTVDIEEVNIPNSPVGLVIRKYDDNGNLLNGAKFKVYKVNSYNPNISLDEQNKTELSFKTIIQGVYENRPVLDTNIVAVSDVDIDSDYYDFENIDSIATSNGSKLKDILKKGTLYISYLDNNSYYIVEEVEAPTGYSISDNKYTLVHIGENQTVIEDTLDAFVNYPTVYTFFKVDEYNNALDGAEFVLQRLNDNKVYETLKVSLLNGIYKVDNDSDNEIITTTNGQASIYYLEEGQYRILEVKNRDGYELNKNNINSSTFFVDREGKVHGESIIVNKKITPSGESKGSSKATLIVNIQTGQKVISYILMIFGTLGVITLLIILVKRNNFKRIFSSK